MPQKFDAQKAENQHYEWMHKLQSIRDQITQDLISRYYDYPPKNQDEFYREQQEMVYHLRKMGYEIEDLSKTIQNQM